MTIVTAQMSVSADGYYAGPEHAGPQPWLEGAEAAGFFRVTRWVIDAEAWRQRLGFKGGEQNTNSQIIAETFASAGAYVMGRRMADGGEIPWGDEPPFRAPVFVVTHRPRQTLHRQGGTSFTYVDDTGMFCCAQQGQERVRHPDGAEDVDRESFHRRVRGQVLGAQPWCRRARVVDQYVQVPVFAVHPGGRRLDAVVVGRVDVEEGRTERARRFGATPRIAGPGQHGVTQVDEPPGCLVSQTLVGSGDQREGHEVPPVSPARPWLGAVRP
jgi:dihydrofolate reductase